MKKKFFKIGNKKIGEDYPTFIIAELSCNHNKNFKTAINSIKEIAKTGADAVKLQTANPDLITLNLKTKNFTLLDNKLWKKKTIYQLEKETHLPQEWHKPLISEAKKLGLICFSSPFDIDSVKFLRSMNMPAYKVASMEINDHELIAEMAKTGKPIIISTGVATLKEIKEAISICYKFKNRNVAILKCTSAYPTPLSEVNLNSIKTLKKFKTIIGISDHTRSAIVPSWAVSFGARIIEKHFIINKKMKTYDSKFSLDPKEFKLMVDNVRDLEKTIGSNKIKIFKSMKSSRKLMRSLYFTDNLKKNEIITRKNLRSIRPNGGLHPKYIKKILGKKVKKNIKLGTPVKFSLIK